LVIAGGESGNAKTIRPSHPDWFRDLRDRCRQESVPFFFKQWGEYDEHGDRVGKAKSGHLLDGQTIWEVPLAAWQMLPPKYQQAWDPV
jgi:protein gp37